MKQITKTIWDDANEEYKDYGFNLEEPDDHTLELYFKDKRIATYNQTKVTAEIIREGCKNYLTSLSRGF